MTDVRFFHVLPASVLCWMKTSKAESAGETTPLITVLSPMEKTVALALHVMELDALFTTIDLAGLVAPSWSWSPVQDAHTVQDPTLSGAYVSV